MGAGILRKWRRSKLGSIIKRENSSMGRIHRHRGCTEVGSHCRLNTFGTVSGVTANPCIKGIQPIQLSCLSSNLVPTFWFLPHALMFISFCFCFHFSPSHTHLSFSSAPPPSHIEFWHQEGPCLYREREREREGASRWCVTKLMCASCGVTFKFTIKYSCLELNFCLSHKRIVSTTKVSTAVNSSSWPKHYSNVGNMVCYSPAIEDRQVGTPIYTQYGYILSKARKLCS